MTFFSELKVEVFVKKSKFSKNTLNLIESIWLLFSFIITVNVADFYHINLLIELLMGILLLIIGKKLIRKFISVNE